MKLFFIGFIVGMFWTAIRAVFVLFLGAKDINKPLFGFFELAAIIGSYFYSVAFGLGITAFVALTYILDWKNIAKYYASLEEEKKEEKEKK
jgi:uncharacterized membrane protein